MGYNMNGFETSFYAPIDFKVIKEPINFKCEKNISDNLELLGGNNNEINNNENNNEIEKENELSNKLNNDNSDNNSNNNLIINKLSDERDLRQGTSTRIPHSANIEVQGLIFDAENNFKGYDNGNYSTVDFQSGGKNSYMFGGSISNKFNTYSNISAPKHHFGGYKPKHKMNMMPSNKNQNPFKNNTMINNDIKFNKDNLQQETAIIENKKQDNISINYSNSQLYKPSNISYDKQQGNPSSINNLNIVQNQSQMTQSMQQNKPQQMTQSMQQNKPQQMTQSMQQNKPQQMTQS